MEISLRCRNLKKVQLHRCELVHHANRGLKRPRSGCTASTKPVKPRSGPSPTRTDSPTGKRVFGRGALIPVSTCSRISCNFAADWASMPYLIHR